MPMTTDCRSGSIRRIEWRKVKEAHRLSEENIEKVFNQEGKLFDQDSKEKEPEPGCFAFLRRSQRPRYLALLVKEGHKSGKLTIFEDKSLGEGSFGRVSLGKLKARNKDGSVNKMKIAVKCINHEKLRNEGDHTDEEIVTMIGNELRALTRCQHPNVIGLHFVIVYRHETLIGMELAGHGELQNQFSHKPKVTCMQYFTKVMEAVNFCHSRGVVHLDIKPENILMDEDFNVKIADFGLSEMVGNDSMVESPGGTPRYMAPEIFYEEMCNGTKCDVWSLGVMMYKMLLNKSPFDDDELDTLSTEISNMRMQWWSQDLIQEYLKEIFNIDQVYFPPDFPIAPKIIICAMLNFDPLKRPSLDQILALSWISKFRVQN